MPQRQWIYDVYSGDSGALADRANRTGHDAAWGAGYTIRGNFTAVSRWKSGSSWVTGYYGYDIAGNVTKLAGPNVLTESGTPAGDPCPKPRPLRVCIYLDLPGRTEWKTLLCPPWRW